MPRKQSVFPTPIILTVLMNKGGVGKTTTCTNLVGALVEPRHQNNNYRVAAVDLDPQTNFTTILGGEQIAEQEGENLVTIAELLNPENEDASVADFFFEVPRAYFDNRAHLLPGHLDLESLKDDIEFDLKARSPLKGPRSAQAFQATYDVVEFEKKKAKLFADLRRRFKFDLAGNFDFVLIDTPPSRGFLTQLALALSDYVIPVLSPGSRELDGLIDMERLMAEAWANYNRDLRVSGILINEVFEREVLSRDIREILLQRYQGKELVLRTEISRSVRIAEAISNDLTVFESEHRDAKTYCDLYRKVIRELNGRALGTSVNSVVSPEIFYDLHFAENDEVMEAVGNG